MAFILDLTKLQPFDIVLTRQKHARSLFIRLFSWGKYSHALICLTPSSLIEATIEGRVFTENPQRLIFDNINDCIVLRPNCTITQSQQRIMEEFLRNQIGSYYSISGALKIPLLSKFNIFAKENGQFCSRLVAQAYQKIGVLLAKNPNYCTPHQIYKSNQLKLVENCVRVASKEDVALSNTPSQIKENQYLTYLWLDNVKKLAKKEKFKITKQSDTDIFVRQHPLYDRNICDYIEASGYLDHYKKDETINSYRYKFMINKKISIQQEVRINLLTFKRFSNNYLISKKEYYNSGLCYYKIFQDLYANIINQCDQRVDILKSYIQRDINNSTNNSTLQELHITNLHLNTLKKNIVQFKTTNNI